jgi:hypothetical protein
MWSDKRLSIFIKSSQSRMHWQLEGNGTDSFTAITKRELRFSISFFTACGLNVTGFTKPSTFLEEGLKFGLISKRK